MNYCEVGKKHDKTTCLKDTIVHRRGELDFKQKVMDSLVDSLKPCI